MPNIDCADDRYHYRLGYCATHEGPTHHTYMYIIPIETIIIMCTARDGYNYYYNIVYPTLWVGRYTSIYNLRESTYYYNIMFIKLYSL